MNKIKRVSTLKEAASMVDILMPFTYRDGHVFARRWDARCESRRAASNGQVYVVYSYGGHFPMYVYDEQVQKWFGHTKKYSKTTSRHQAICQPNENIQWVSLDEVIGIVDYRGVTNWLIHKESRQAP